MIHIQPRRFAGMLDNALAAAKQGTKPFPWVMILALDNTLTVAGIGQHTMVEDTEPDMGGGEDGVAIPIKEAEQVAKTVRSTDGALRKDHTVYLTITDGVLRVDNGGDTIIEIADVGDEADAAWEFRANHQQYYGEPYRKGERYTIYETSILSVLGKLKPAEPESRILLYPGHVADTTMLRIGSVRGFIEGNRSTLGSLGMEELF